MFKINKLFSEPDVFDPIEFTKGFNLIFGEKTPDNDKTNSVGKSMMIEFINFALLNDFAKGRVKRIPKKTLSLETDIHLDFQINNHEIQSVRRLSTPNCVTLIVDGNENQYQIQDARDYLTNLFFENLEHHGPSFRRMMGPLIRDEKSEFKDIINCYDTKLRIPPYFSPHLIFLHIDPAPYESAKKLYDERTTVNAAKISAAKHIRALTGSDVLQAKADLNELKRQVQIIDNDLERLESIESYNIVEEEIVAIETQLITSRNEQGVLKAELSVLTLFNEDDYIDNEEVGELYNHFKSSLGDFIKKELEQVSAFKQKIDHFQEVLLAERRESINKKLKELKTKITALDTRRSKNLSILKQEGAFISLKQTMAASLVKTRELASLSSAMEKHTSLSYELETLTQERKNKIFELRQLRRDSENIIGSLEKTILEIHHYVFGNERSSFEVSIKKTKPVCEFVLRVDADGGHSNDREKVFLYDLGLLLNPKTSEYHPGFLLHDNIFDVDQHTLVKSINYIGENLHKFEQKQYILTINRDKFNDSDIADLNINLDDFKRASFTKKNKFLRKQYQEDQKK